MSETAQNPVPDEPIDAGNDPAREVATTEEPAPERVARARGGARHLLSIVGIASLVLVLDQLSKLWAERTLAVGDAPLPLIGELIQLRLIYNSGAALSIGGNVTWLLTLLSCGVVVFIVVMARRIRSVRWALALGLVLGGALGNLGDRLFRAPGFPSGHVVDFIDYGPFIGNVADIAIVGAAVLIAVLAFVGIGPDGERLEHEKDGSGASGAGSVSDDAGTADADPASRPDTTAL